MSDNSVRAALRSDAQMVLVEAPAGCGKTYQGADYAKEMVASGKTKRLLIITHTHAACSMFSDHTKGLRSGIDIRTIDSVVGQIASVYHSGLGLPADIAGWVRQRENGYTELAIKVATLLNNHTMIADSLVQRYPIIICDEHQDSSGDQHSMLMSLLREGAKVRIFADPMQNIFKDRAEGSKCAPCDWGQLSGQAQAFEQLDVPHRWSRGCSDLGQWTLKVREVLKSGGKIDLRSGLPPSVKIVFAENQSQKNLDYQLKSNDRKQVDDFADSQQSLLVLTRYNDTARSLRSFFGRRVLLWEGHTRPGLEKLVDKVCSCPGDCAALAAAVVKFMGDIGKGFSPSAFGNQFEREVQDGCSTMRRGKPAKIQELARFLMTNPDHRGIANVLRRLWELKDTDKDFANIEIDCYKEFWEAIRLEHFDTADVGLAEITQRRSHSLPKPPNRAISIVHKAKGLECGSAIIIPCDAKTFPNNPESRCLFYVGISRAKDQLMLVVSRANPSPLLEL